MSNDSLNKNTSKTFVKGALIMTVSMIVVKLLGMFYKVILTNMYGEFGANLAGIGSGLLQNAYEVYNPLFALATAGFPIAVSRLIAESITQKRYRDVAVIHKTSKKFFVIMGTICFGLMLGVSFVWIRIVSQPLSIYAMMTLAPSIFIGCMLSVYRGYYEGQRNMFPTAVSEVLEAIGKVFIGLSLGYLVMKLGMKEFAESGTVFGRTFAAPSTAMETLLAYSVAAAIAGITIGSLMAFIFLRIYYIKHVFGVPDELMRDSIDARTQNETFKLLLKTAIPIGLSAIIMNISGSIDTVVVQNVLYNISQNNASGLVAQFKGHADEMWKMIPSHPTDVEPVTIHTYLSGCFGMALTVMQLVTTVTQVFGTSALPNVTAAYTSGDKAELKRSIETVLKMTMLFTLPAGLALFAIPYPVITLLYGVRTETEIAASVLRVMGFSCIVVAVSTPICSMLQGIGKVKLPLILCSIAMAIKILTNFLFVNIVEMNITGAAVGSLVAFTFVCIVGMYLLIRHSKVRPNFVSTILKPLISAALCAVTAYFSYRLFSGFAKNAIATVLSVIAAGIVYIAALLLMKTFSEAEINMLPKGKNIVTILAKLHLLG